MAENLIHKQDGKRYHNFRDSVINAMLHQIAIIDLEGVIIATNDMWDKFCLRNMGNPDRCGIGNSYLAVSTKAMKKGINTVLTGEADKFITEYPCHSSEEKRWFSVVVTPLVNEYEAGIVDGAVISHMNITDRKLLEIKQKKELELARSIQQSVLMPSIEDPAISIEGLFLPSNYLSGDMYAWYKIDKDHYGVMLLDIMGHGISSSLISMSIRSLLQGIITRVSNPIEVYQELNKQFYALFRTVRVPKLYFCTGIYLLINIKEKSVQYFNAGQPNGLLIGDNKDQILKKTTVPIGLRENPEIECQTVHYTSGDRLVLYTDGFGDSMHLSPSECEQFILEEGHNRLRSLESADIVTDLLGDSEQVDDISIVSIKF